MYRAKDFIETLEGLAFAVVSETLEDDKVLCFLRYIRKHGLWKKLSTSQANNLLSEKYNQYQYFSSRLDVELHAVPISAIIKHHLPQSRLATLVDSRPQDPVEEDVQTICHLFEQNGLKLEDVGITGSILIGAQTLYSDIDLVFYTREAFQHARIIIQALTVKGNCQLLTENAWLESYQRRDCELTFQEYLWHEQRKSNKVMINRRKIDLTMLIDDGYQYEGVFNKLGEIKIQARVIEDFYGFDYPAVFMIDDDNIHSVVCFTATYSGQAKAGEKVEVAGQLEQSQEGLKRIVVGSTREARGEYIKVI